MQEGWDICTEQLGTFRNRKPLEKGFCSSRWSQWVWSHSCIASVRARVPLKLEGVWKGSGTHVCSVTAVSSVLLSDNKKCVRLKRLVYSLAQRGNQACQGLILLHCQQSSKVLTKKLSDLCFVSAFSFPTWRRSLFLSRVGQIQTLEWEAF